MDIFGIRSASDVRAFLYVLLPVVGTMLVGYGTLTDTQWQLWAGLVSAVLGPVIAAVKAKDVSTFRTAFYSVLAAVQALVIGYNVTTQAVFDHWLPLVVAVVGLGAGGVAAANTDTTTSGRHALPA